MKIETIKNRLGGVISKIEKTVGKNINLPILSCVYMEAKKDGLTLRVTNLDLGVEITVPVRVEKEGVVAVPAHTLSNLLGLIEDDDKVVFNVSDNTLSVETKTSVSHIKTLPADDFPTIPKTNSKNKTTIHTIEFVEGIKAVAGSASVSTIKPELSSVYIYPEENELVFVATDSFRLSEKRIPLKKGGFTEGILIPVKNTLEIARLLDGITGDVEVVFGEGQIHFSVDGLYITSRVVDGVFPNYKQIIPKEHNTEVMVLKDEFFSSVKMANIFSDKFNKIQFVVDPKKNDLTIYTKNNDVGDVKKTLKVQVEGEPIDVNFNYKYITDGFSSLSGQSASLKFNGAQKPLVVRGKGDNSFLYLVMPMNK